MNAQPEDIRDENLHTHLLRAGPDLEASGAPDALRAGVLEACKTSAGAARWPSAARRTAGGLGGIAAVLAIAAAILAVQNARLAARVRAVASRPVASPTPVHEEPRFVLVNFYHDQCPIAAQVTPRFRQMAQSHARDPVLFVTLDVSPGSELQAGALVDCLNCKPVLASPPGTESGVVKVLDRASGKIVLTAFGASEFDRIPAFLDEYLHARR